MIEAIRSWLTAAVAASFLTAAAQSLIPEGAVRKAAGFAGGLALICVLLEPFLTLDFSRAELSYDACAQRVEERREELQDQSDRELERLIAERTQAYIQDKAAELGAACTVRVLVEPGEDGVPVPAGAVVAGECPGALADYMERELGISKERQVYHEAD